MFIQFAIAVFLYCLSFTVLAADPKYYCTIPRACPLRLFRNAKWTSSVSLTAGVDGSLYHANVSTFTNVVPILGFSFSANASRDIATGMSTGKNVYTPVTLYKKMDISSPLLMRILTTNEVFQATISAVEPASGVLCNWNFVLSLSDLLSVMQMATSQPHSRGNLPTELWIAYHILLVLQHWSRQLPWCFRKWKSMRLRVVQQWWQVSTPRHLLSEVAGSKSR